MGAGADREEGLGLNPRALRWLPARETRKNQQRRREGEAREVGGEPGKRGALGTKWRNCVQEEGELQEEGAAANAAERSGRGRLRNSRSIQQHGSWRP